MNIVANFFNRSDIPLHNVGVGSQNISIPVADMQGSTAGKTVLITAGMDGDEYAGIEAAYSIIKKYKKTNFKGRLIVLPLINLPGFEVEHSYNPQDGLFPKNIFPGTATGTPTEQLIYWLANTYAFKADSWIDLHSGAITESLFPFVHVFKTGIASIDTSISKFCTLSGAETILQQKVMKGSKAGLLAQHGCSYILLESGGRGERRDADIQRHRDWVDIHLNQLGIIDIKSSKSAETKPFTDIVYTNAPYNGFFEPVHLKLEVSSGDKLGILRRYDSLKGKEMYATKTGRVLWFKQTMAARKGDVLYAVAS